jgi:hypothetical protein
VPVAANGGWTDASTFVADVAFLETPHRVRVTCSAADGGLVVQWATTPLHAGSVLELRRP